MRQKRCESQTAINIVGSVMRPVMASTAQPQRVQSPGQALESVPEPAVDEASNAQVREEAEVV